MYTNAELYAAMTMSSSPDMPYVYQDFNWDHCREQGYHFDDLLVQWGTQSSEAAVFSFFAGGCRRSCVAEEELD